jgi:hypothetical protein
MRIHCPLFKTMIILILSVVFPLCSTNEQVVERGFGYSSILHSRHSGNGIDGSFEQLFGEKTNGDIENIYSINMPDLKNSYLVKNGDVNGDGMDDLIIVYRYQVSNSVLVIFDGNDGTELWRYYSPGNGYGCYMIEVGDFNGDGKDDIAHIRHASTDRNRDGIGDGSFLQVFTFDLKGNGTQIWGYSPQDARESYLVSTDAIFLMKKGDFNGDHHDDLAVVHHWGRDINADGVKDNSLMVVLDGRDGKKTFSFHPYNQNSGGYGCYLIATGDFNGDGIDDVAHLRHSSTDRNRDRIGDGSYLQVFTFNEIGTGKQIWGYSPQDARESHLVSTDAIFLMKKGDFNGDHRDDLVVVHHWGRDINADLVKDNSLMVVLDGRNGKKMFSFHPFDKNSGGSGCYLIETGDFDGDGFDEIAHARHSSSDLDGDGFADGTFLEIRDGNGTFLWGYSPQNANVPDLVHTDGVYLIGIGDFNGDDRDDLAVVHHWRTSNSIMVLLNGENGNTIHTHKNETFSCSSISIIKNEITDEELLRSFSSRYPSVLDLYNYYTKNKTYPTFNKDTQGNEMGNIADYYPESSSPNIKFTEQIKKFATTYCREDYPNTSEYINHATTACLRLRRIANTFKWRKDDKSLTLTDFRFGIKSILSHLRWCSLDGDNHYVAGTNHGLLFELPYYLKSASLLTEFKDYPTWRSIFERRLRNQMGHIFADGMHDEHSLNYEWFVAYISMKMRQFISDNNSILGISSGIETTLGSKVEDMFQYFLYVVKPLTPVAPDSSDDGVTDFPVIGDSYNSFGRAYGKEDLPDSDGFSLLMYPIHNNHTDGWSNTLIQNLRFAANSTGGSSPKIISKAFNNGGTFISRSNWETSTNSLDKEARYCLFKGGEMRPQTTTSNHCHADLLSVDITAFGKHIVVDPGGYIAEGYEAVSDISSAFNNLYNYNPYGVDEQFKMVRHYFKGTAGHNTLYINNKDQAEYVDNFAWQGTNDIKNLGMKVNKNSEFDLVSAGYENNDANHTRQMLYVKPNVSGSIELDYWVITDIAQVNDPGIAEQIWHIAPEQTSSLDFDQTTGILKGDNFWILPITNNIQSKNRKFIDGYYFHLRDASANLVPMKILKYKGNRTRKQSFCTIIFPFSEDLFGKTDPKISKITVKNKLGRPYSDDIVQAFKLNFKYDEMNYVDYCLISHNSNSTYFIWNNGSSSAARTSAKMEFRRYKNNNLVKKIVLNYDPQKTKYPLEPFNNNEDNDIEPKQYKLNQNYPNPFNPTTTISYSLAHSSHVEIKVYNILGHEIRTLINEFKENGQYSVQWNGKNSSGKMYLRAYIFIRYEQVILVS